MPPALSGDGPRPSRYALFAARLKDAHGALRDPRIPAAHQVDLVKRVLAITALARHDVSTALSRLDAFSAELAALLEGGSGAHPDGHPVPSQRPSAEPDVPSSGKNTATQG